MTNIETQIKEKLKSIIDPDLHQDIVSLGFVKNISWEGKNEGLDVKLTLELTSPACPVKETFKQDAERLIKEIKEVASVEVHLSSRQRNHQEESSLQSVKNIIAVASCKGGVGKSTVAAMIACELASQGYQVGLLDIDLFGPSLPTLFDVSINGVQAKDKKLLPIEKEIILQNGDANLLKLMSFGFLLGDSPAIMRGPMVSNYIQQLLHQVDWGDLDYLFIDLPPGTGDTQLTLSQSVTLDGAMIITTGQSLSLVDVSKGILMFEKVNVPILGLVENMSYFTCHHCNEKHYPFRSGKGEGTSQGVEGLKNRFGIPLLAEIPFLASQKIFFKNYQPQSLAKNMIDNMARELGKKTFNKAPQPEVQWNEQELFVNGEQKFSVSHRNLRFNCLCALCVDEVTGEKKITLKDIQENISPQKVEPVGNYAISIKWNDGHHSGIYPYRLIEKLSQQKANG
ncbi:iron-sulfur cluster carrier protein-like [Ylistrum balloti]|uniref:iron-sulfur cluster carrier protein-like n=1 Tax=Ylistrum balloti TaxID=509963 RepID=UPI0029058092|nr:iron-sulfur cluster carrier protein-like [Ylistrum balloti]